MPQITKIVLGIVILALVVWGIVSFSKPQPASGEPIKIGAILPLTGGGDFFGEEARNGIKLALEDAKSRIEIITEDSQTQPRTAASAAQKLISQDGVSFLISWMSSPSSAVAPISEDNMVILIYGSTLNKIATDHTYAFKNYISIEKDCAALASYFKGKRGALLGINFDSTTACVDEFLEAGFNLEPELYQRGTADFRTFLTKIKGRNPEFLVLRSLPTETDVIFRQMSELGLKDVIIVCPHLSGVKCDSEIIKKDYGDLLKGAVSTDFFFDLTNRAIKDFSEEYEKNFGRRPTADAIYAYEDILVFDRAIRACKNFSERLSTCARERLLGETFDGLDGQLRFDQSGIVERKTSILQFNGEGWIGL